MKNIYLNTILFIIISCLLSFSALAQITPNPIKQFILDNNDVKFEPEIQEFYARLNYKTVWTPKENAVNLSIFLNTLKFSASKGLLEDDYQFNFIKSFRLNTISLQTKDDTLEAEVRITDAAIHFYNEVANGNTKPILGFNGLNYIPSCRDIPALLADYISKNKLQLLITDLSPVIPEIIAIENKLKWFQFIRANSNFKEVIITSKELNGTNEALISKLYQLGIIDTIKNKFSHYILKQKVKEAQLQFNLPADGELGNATIKELNVPFTVRFKQLNLSVNYYRWLSCLAQNQSVILVNIPAAYLKVYQSDKVILEMRLIAGKPSTPTPTLSSRINEVILYPYWHVPKSIATKELLPAIKRDPGFLNKNNYQVLNMAGKIMNPYSINWQALSTSYFPYIIRQYTGCDNALGLLKLNFYNPFSVYLHDTPNKSLFKQDKRFYSHGCMRMEKPMDLGHLVLKNNFIAIDTLTQKGCLRNKSPIIVKPDESMPVIVWYNPAGIDSSGRIVFYEDVYGKFNWKRKK